MRALVIYESMYGNTQRVAESIAAGLRPQMDALAIEVGNSDTPVISTEIGIREWIAAQKEHAVRVPTATFGTRFKMSRRLTGSAAKNAEKKLRKHGFEMIIPAESFFVEGETGPLYSGEQERAHQWGETLTVRLVTAR